MRSAWQALYGPVRASSSAASPAPSGRVSGHRAGARARAAAGAAVGEALRGPLQVDPDHVGHAHQPGQRVAQLMGELVRVTVAQGLGDLADLLDEPAEGAVDATLPI